MKFLEAHQLVSGSNGGAPFPFLLAMSGTAMPLDLYVRAHAVQRGLAAEVRHLEFNTLHQALVDSPRRDEREVFLLFPWPPTAGFVAFSSGRRYGCSED